MLKNRLNLGNIHVMKSTSFLGVTLATLSFTHLVPASQAEVKGYTPAQLQFFESKIRPVFAGKCYNCHSHQAKKLKGGLYMDSRAGLLEGGDTDPAIVPGDPDASLLIEAIAYDEPDLQMPPKSKLPAKDIENIRKWIADGAAWPKEPAPVAGKKSSAGIDIETRKASHWSWKPLADPELPEVKDKDWSSHPVDRFILSKLEKAGLEPAKAADKGTLLRRLHFILQGIPPTEEELGLFMAHKHEDTYGRTIDRLLESPRFGERWARHWLDLVRYAESRGHEFDYEAANAYRYRDYVIRAFNADVPYDQFVHEHIAGDLLPKPRLHPEEKFNESILGTGFWFLGEWVHSPVDTRQDEADRYDNMIDVATKTFLGLTVACARCHDHKFDAITAKDYYAFSGFLQSSNYRQARFDTIVHNGKIKKELDTVDLQAKEAWGAWKKSLPQSLENTESYLHAAKGILDGGIAYKQTDISLETTKDIVFEDFEDGTYLGWVTTGDAFGNEPVTAKTKGRNQPNTQEQGTYFVNSYNLRKDNKGGRGDHHTGTLTSSDFKIERDFITFLIGGGSHKGKTCLNLLIGGKVIETATGNNHNTMTRKFWDVSQYRGKEAKIQAVDNFKGGWGNIGFDDIQFTNTLPEGAKAVGKDPADRDYAVKTQKAITETANSKGLDHKTLEHWIRALVKAEKNPGNPLHKLAKARNKKIQASPPSPQAEGDAFSKALEALDMVINYSKTQPHHFLQDGYTFRHVNKGDILWGTAPEVPVQGIAKYGAARKDPGWHGLNIVDSSLDSGGGLRYPRAGMTLRTPTFKLEEGRVWYLVKGKATALAVVNSHRLVQGPLHGNTKLKIGAENKLNWYGHSLNKKGQTFVGEKIHVEFTPEGAGFEVLMVVQGDNTDARNTVLKHLQGISAEAFAPNVSGSHFEAIAKDFVKQLPMEGTEWLLANPDLFPGLSPANSPALGKLVKIRQNLLSQIKKDSRTAMAMQDGSAEDEAEFKRGNPRTPGDIVPRRFLEALGGKAIKAKGSGRLDLARSITSPTNPYTSRVMVNRVWHHLFGTGIVPSTDDFGVLGQEPSHPELLDHLATKFMQEGWSTKQLIRYILSSRTWQMSSDATNPTAEEKDPTNRLLHRMPIRRMEGEILRDSLLAISGKLKHQPFGKPTPIHLSSFLTGRGRPGSGPLDGNGRRSIYLSVRRNFLSPLMLAFDTPSPFNTVGRRTVSNVPSQALMLMNDPFIRAQSKLWGNKIKSLQDPLPERIQAMYRQAYSREPSEEELATLQSFMESQSQTDPNNAWATLAHVLVSSKEFVLVH